MRLAWGWVVGVDRISADYEELTVRFEDEAASSDARAVCYPALSGHVMPGERVLLNTTAVDLDLGTGGLHFVVARATEKATGEPQLDAPSGGHVMKLRYTPLQLDVLSVEEQGSASHPAMATATDLGGMPVACCGLHSQAPLVAAAIKTSNPDLTVAYVMTDFAALPLALSKVVRESVKAGLIDATVTCGQAFGGTLEAVNLHSGLLAARHVSHADIAIVAIGPGVVGTATPFGHGGIAQGEAINAVASLGGRPVAVLRLSQADTRPRHQGVSHHTTTALTKIALAPAMVAMPRRDGRNDWRLDEVERMLASAGVWTRHERREAPALEPDTRGVVVTSMGRGPADDLLFFSAAYAAGGVCVQLLGET